MFTVTHNVLQEDHKEESMHELSQKEKMEEEKEEEEQVKEEQHRHVASYWHRVTQEDFYKTSITLATTVKAK